MKAHKRKSKTIGYNVIKCFPETLYALNDGRLAIGGDNSLVIYNMKTYGADIKIEDEKEHQFLLQLKDNRLFIIVIKKRVRVHGMIYFFTII